MTSAGGKRAASRARPRGGARGADIGAWIKKTADKVPTAYFGAIVTAVFLLVTAAFGSLNAAPGVVPPTAQLDERIVTSDLAFTVDDVVIAAPNDNDVIAHTEGHSVVVMTVTIENLTTRPIGVASSVADMMFGVLEGTDAAIEPAFDGPAQMVDAIEADSVLMAEPLSPGVPRTVRIGWLVASAGLTDAPLTIDFWNRTLTPGSWIAPERTLFWTRTDVAARLSVTLQQAPEEPES